MSWPSLLDDIAQFLRLGTEERKEVCDAIRGLDPPTEVAELAEVLAAIRAAFQEVLGTAAYRAEHLDQLMNSLVPRLVRTKGAGLSVLALSSAAQPEIDAAADQLAALYGQLTHQHAVRWQLLRTLATLGSDAAITALVEALVGDPPPSRREIDLVYAQLWRHPQLPTSLIYPQLLAALAHPQQAALVLELANHLYRAQGERPHPCTARGAQLERLFVGLVDELNRLEKHPAEFARTTEELSQIVERSTNLAAALADALGLIGAPTAIEALEKAIEVRHRRVQAEAAAALARLGDRKGVERLVKLAHDAVIRTRATAYLEEAGAIDELPPELRTKPAQAEGELVARLAQPQQYGLPPNFVELFDHRRLRWPGFREAVDCFLFRFRYQFPGRSFEGIAMAGPLVHHLPLDFGPLAPFDIYAVYCGWHVEHAEIRRIGVDALAPADVDAYAELKAEAAERGFQVHLPLELVHFFGTPIWFLDVARDAQTGVLVVSEGQFVFHPLAGTPRSLGANEIFYLEIGRRILGHFNG